MNKYCIILLAAFLAVTSNGQLLRSHDSGFEVTLMKLCKAHYLFDDIALDTNGANQISIWLTAKTWSNPKDTKTLVDSIKLLAESSSLKEYKVLVFGKPTPSMRIAQITIGPTGSELDYTYTKAKQESLSVGKSTWKTVDVLQVRGLRIYKGLHADSVFMSLTTADRTSEPDIINDGSGNLTGTHHWKVDDKLIDITFARWDGMYRVQGIRTRDVGKSPQVKSNNDTQKEAATRPKSCCLYDDCKAYGGCKNYSNCYGACLDDCMRVGCPLCK